MRLVVAAVGKVKERGLRETLDDYLGRLRRYVPTDEVELRDGSTADVAAAFAKVAPEGVSLVALEVGGRAHSSEGFARLVERLGSTGKGVVVFAIGGADGLPAEVSRRATATLSLGAMTLPHRLARLVLVEQLYRAMTILRGEPYHH